MASTFLQPGKNCWRLVRADRLAFLLDGETYYSAVRAAALKAHHSIRILSWDIHSRIELVRGAPPEDGLPAQLGPFFKALLKRRPALNIHILNWDYAMIYATEREWRMLSDTFGRPPARLHFRTDANLPLSASHHQKVVVIDDRVAFIGGLDLSLWRWDTSEHLYEDPRRYDPPGKAYQPYHDVQALVSGEAAQTLGELFRDRWLRASGQSLDTPNQTAFTGRELPWPAAIEPDLEDVEVGIARTQAIHDNHPAIYEVRQAHFDAIALARRCILLVNQYLSSPELVDALAERLREPDGPEIVLVITNKAEGWLEEKTMGVIRNRLLETLQEADAHGRFRVYHPEAVDGDRRRLIYVHSKLFMIDDRIVQVGSANLSNRSMKVDTEAVLLLDRPTPDQAVINFRNRLLASYFHQTPEHVREVIDQHPSFITGVESLINPEQNSLQPLEFASVNDAERALADSQILDPDEPVDPGYWLLRTIPARKRRSVLRRLTYSAIGLTFILLSALMFTNGWGLRVDEATVEGMVESFRHHRSTPLLLVLFFFVGGVSGFSINALLVATVLTVGPVSALAAGLIGAHLNALAAYYVGRRAGLARIKRLSIRDIDTLGRWIGQLGIIGLALARLMPVAPILIVNLIAGATRLRPLIFYWGTLLGLLPGMLIVVVLTDRIRAVSQSPGWLSILILAAVLTAAFSGFAFVQRKLALQPQPATEA